MPRQRMENFQHLGGKILNQVREELKKFPDEVLAHEEVISEEFDPESLPIFLVDRNNHLYGAVGVPQDQLRSILITAILNDVGMVKIREEEPKKKQPKLQTPNAIDEVMALLGRNQAAGVRTLTTGTGMFTLRAAGGAGGGGVEVRDLPPFCANCGGLLDVNIPLFVNNGIRRGFCSIGCREAYLIHVINVPPPEMEEDDDGWGDEEEEED